MNIETGQIKQMDSDDFKAMPKEEQAKYRPILRDLTALETANKQLKLYSPCGCGSGKKFKFCCYAPRR